LQIKINKLKFGNLLAFSPSLALNDDEDLTDSTHNPENHHAGTLAEQYSRTEYDDAVPQN